MSDGLRDALASALTYLTPGPHGSWFWHAQLVGRLSSDILNTVTTRQRDRWAIDALQELLYTTCYCRGGVNSSEEAFGARMTYDERSLFEALSACVNGYTISTGWRCERKGHEGIIVSRSGRRVVAPMERVEDNSTEVTLRIKRLCRSRSPGFVLLIGSAPSSDVLEGELVRVYWHVQAHRAPELAAKLTAELDATGLQYQVKFLADPDAYRERRDTAVLYLPRDQWSRARGRIATVYHKMTSSLDSGVPMFVKELLPGLGVAEDPPGQVSFGSHRCRLMAESLQRTRRRSVSGRVDAIALAFRAAGIDWGRPHLNPRSRRDYTLQ